MKPGPKRTSPLEQFTKHTSKQQGCWPWLGKQTAQGYGQIRVDEEGEKKRYIYAHRYSHELHNGAIPHGLLIRHSCDNPNCVNPAHLSVGNKVDNALDMVERSRHFMQKRTHCAKGHELSEDNILFHSGRTGRTYRSCAKCYKATTAARTAKHAESARVRSIDRRKNIKLAKFGDDPLAAIFHAVPTYCIGGWCKYKGQQYASQVNVEASTKANMPMLDLFFCLTEMLNGTPIRTVRYHKTKFEPCQLGEHT